MITRFYPYTLTLEAPAVITALEGDPNSARSLDFIPGSAIRGAMASRLDPNNNFPTFKQYILSGQVCFLNAYPMANGQRTLPMPGSFRQEKYGDTTYDLAFYSGESEVDEPDAGDVWPAEQLKGMEAPFLSLGQARPRAAHVTFDSRVHQQRDRSAGRAYTYQNPATGVEEARGTIFTYEALEAGQQFEGIIAISGQDQNETCALWKKIKSVLGDRLSLGRSRNARYGGSAAVTWETPRDYETASATRVILRKKDLQGGNCFCVFLTSDYVGRDPGSGQSDPTAFRRDVINRLGQNRVEVLRTRWAFRPIGGFNRKWGLQLPQTLALQAGSLLVLKAKADIPYADLSTIEWAGLGERRPEGFGRVIFLEAPRETRAIDNAPTPDPLGPPDSPVPDLINTMQKRIIMDALKQRITGAAANLTRNAERIPNPSLLGRLRVPLRKGPAGLETLRGWLDASGGAHRLRRPAMNQLDDCRIDNKQTTLVQWIRKRVNATDDTADLKKNLEIPRVRQRNYIESAQAAEDTLDQATAQQLTVRLIDEVLALLARQKRLASRGEQHADDS